MFDHELFVEFGARRFGPYRPSGGPIPLYRYRKPRKTTVQRRADRIGALAEQISIPRSALSGEEEILAPPAPLVPLPQRGFVDPDPYGQFTYASRLDALRGVSDLLRRPLARLAEEDLAFVNELVDWTLDKAAIALEVKERFDQKRKEAAHADR